MTPIYGRSICHDPRHDPVTPRDIPVILGEKCHDPCHDPVTPYVNYLLCKMAQCHDCHDVTTKNERDGRCRKSLLKGQKPTYFPSPIQNAVTVVTPQKRQSIYGGIGGFALYGNMIYNVCHEKITSGYNYSIDGRSEGPAPANVRRNGYLSNGRYGVGSSSTGKRMFERKGKKVMDITYYPNGKSNEGFEIGHIVNNMRVRWYKRHGRLMAKIKPVNDKCAHCGADSGWMKGRALQSHHIKPIWAWMLEQLLRQPPRDRKEGEDMAYRAMWGLMEFDTHFHTPDNLIHLCKRCHEKEEARTIREWKAYFNQLPNVSVR